MHEFEYIVMTPPFMRGSAGIRFLNELTDDIRATGRKVHRIYSFTANVGLVAGTDGEKFYKCEPDLLRHLTGNPKKLIVIHGENQDCQYFMGLNVARYYLNRIGALRKVGIPRDGEFKITWDAAFCDAPDFTLRTCTLRYPPQKAASLELKERDIDLTYIGKAKLKLPNAARLPDTLELRRDWPDNDDEYFYLLKRTRYLYTYDTVTSVVDDAITFGAIPISIAERLEDPAYTGCVAHIDDDLNTFKQGFAAARLQYLESQVRIAARYKADLERCCLAMEKFFG